MNSKRHLLVLDPTAFAGGSKVATENILRLLNSDRVRITVLSADRHSWHRLQLNRIKLYEPKWLSRQEQGVAYFLRNTVVALNLLLARVRYGRFDIALGASGPGVDLALYLIKPLLGFKLVKLIHGPVACSHTIGRALHGADENHYLGSAHDSLDCALSTLSATPPQLTPPRFQVLENGLSKVLWPSRSQSERPVIFWAASLLKWKGLEILLDALREIDLKQRPETHICYIRPKKTLLPVSQAPVDIGSVHWHESPKQFDKLRASASIFVSTSENEPFGLSILEAMAAGHCVVIPADGAYWDQTLQEGIDCIKYTPGDAADLAVKLLALSHDMALVKRVGDSSARVAESYRAESRYTVIKNSLERLYSLSAAAGSSPAETEARP